MNIEDIKRFYKEPYVDVVYDILESEMGESGLISENWILLLVGVRGLNALTINGLVETHTSDDGNDFLP